jgi:hypothetical protein
MVVSNLQIYFTLDFFFNIILNTILRSGELCGQLSDYQHLKMDSDPWNKQPTFLIS